MGQEGEREHGASSVLATYLDQILALRQAGEEVDVEALAGGDPELARELAVMLSTLDVVEGHAGAGAQPLAAGRMVGDYRIVRELGRGGMGVVFLAEDRRLGRRVALKFLPVQAALDANLRERFGREARAAGRLHHPNIVAVHGLGEQEGFLFLVMQYVEGVSLDQLVRRSVADEPYPQHPVFESDPGRPGADAGAAFFRGVASLGAQLADALSYAHSHGIVHRDVKPANVLVSAEGDVHITDFGLCELRGEEQLTRTNAVLGTPRYMAPEQFLGRSTVQSDVYGLGATLYEALTGQPPYGGGVAGGVGDPAGYEERLVNLPPRPRKLTRSVPPALEAIVLMAMAPLSEERYASALNLKRDLQAFLDNRPVLAQPPGPAHILRLAYRRNRLVTWVLALAVAALALLTLAHLQGLRAAQRNEERRAYVATIAAASSAFRAGDEDLASKSLDASPERLRSWEWRHLEARLAGRAPGPATGPATGRAAGLAAGLIDFGGRICALERSPDGRWLAVGLRGSVVLVDLTATERRFEFPHGSDVWGLCFSADGAQLVSCDHTGVLLRISLGEMPELVAEASYPLPKARVPAFDPSGQRIAVGCYDGSVGLFDLDLNPLGERVFVHGSRIYDLSFDAEGTHLLTCGADGTLRSLELATGLNRLLMRHTDIVHDLDLHGTEPWVAISGWDGLLEVWDHSSGTRVESWRIPGAESVTDVNFTDDGRHVVASSNESSVSVWELGRSEVVQQLSVPKGAVWCLAWEPSSQMVLGGGRLGSIHGIDVFYPGGKLLARPHVGSVRDAEFSPDGLRLATTGQDTNVCVLDGRTGRMVQLFQAHLEYGTAVSFGSRGRWLASGDESGRVILWDLETGTARADTGAEGGRDVADLAFTADGERLLVARQQSPLEVYALPVLVPVQSSGSELPKGVSRIAIAGERVALASGATIQLRRASDLALERELEADSAVAALAFHPARPRLVAGQSDGTVTTWDLERGGRVGDFALRPGAAAPAREILDLAYHPGGRHLAVATERMTPLLVDAQTGEELLLLSGLLEFSSAVALSPDGRAIACGGSMGDVVFWDELDSGQRRAAAESSGVDAVGSAALEGAASPAGLRRRVRDVCITDDLSAEELYHGFLMAQELFHHNVYDTTGYFLMNRIQVRRQQELAYGRIEGLARSGVEPRGEIFLTFLLSLLDRGEVQRAAIELAGGESIDFEGLAEVFSPKDWARLQALGVSGR